MTRRDETGAETTDGAGIARTFFRLRLFMSCVIAALVVHTVVKAYRSHAAVHHAAATEAVAGDIGRVLALGARERGLATLVANDAAGAPDRNVLSALRTELDRLTAATLRDTAALAAADGDRVLAALVETAEVRRRAAVSGRAELERAGVGPARVAATDRWIDETTAINEALLVLHAELQQPDGDAFPELHEVRQLRQLLLVAAEHTGQERAIVSGALARHEVVGPERVTDLERRRGVVEHSLEDLAAYLAPRTEPPHLAGALALMRRDFLEQLSPTRREAYRCVRGAQPCSLTASQWFEHVSAGIDAVSGVVEAASQHAAALIEERRLAALRSLVGTAVAGTFAFALILFASSFVRHRIGQRLLDLRDGALQVARGELERPVVVPGTDEITAVAHAVEQMRATLNRRNTELERLIDQLKEAQGKLVQNERMASVGQLAGGVAHEINNPLSIVLGNIVYLLDQLDRPGDAMPFDRAELRDVLHEVREATERSTAIVRDLRDFAAGGPGTSGRLADLDEAVSTVVSALRPSFPRNVAITTSLSAAVKVVGTRAAIAQVLQRILDNAREACADGGTISVRTTADEGTARIVVHDSGPGIPPDILGRVLEPFFTTKKVGAGRGLGLSVCMGLVRQLGGDLTVESAPGHGTTVTVRLPRA